MSDVPTPDTPDQPDPDDEEQPAEGEGTDDQAEDDTTT
jgi:hypothetical protein